MNFDINKENTFINLADTDSMVISFEPILKKLYPELDLNSIEDTLPKAKQIQNELRPLLNDYQTSIAKSILNLIKSLYIIAPLVLGGHFLRSVENIFPSGGFDSTYSPIFLIPVGFISFL